MKPTNSGQELGKSRVLLLRTTMDTATPYIHMYTYIPNPDVHSRSYNITPAGGVFMMKKAYNYNYVEVEVYGYMYILL